MGRLADGDRRAFDPLYDALWPIVAAFCRRRLGEGPDADDAAQQVMIAVFAKASRYDPARAALPWVLGFAARECASIAARRARHPVASDTDRPIEGPSPEDDVLRADLASAIREAMGGLSEVDEQTLWTSVTGEIGEREVAGATFRKRLERATARLRARWWRQHGRS
jgi:RNA polymerase sigma factor (sigma-70 family)